MTRICAYCGSQGPLTREHIWPKGILQRTDYKARFISQGKVIAGEMTIADVCGRCNNGTLSMLDAYICKLYDRYFHQFYDRGASVEFYYDWSQLGNWFLKASYNSARAAKNKHDTEILKRHTDFIRGLDKRQPDLAIWVDLVEPSYTEERLQSGIYSVKKLIPKMVRFARILIPDTTLQHYTIRVAAINSFYFYFAIPIQPYMIPHTTEMTYISEFFAQMALLSPELMQVTIKTTGFTAYDMIAPHIIQNEKAYRRYQDDHDEIRGSQAGA